METAKSNSLLFLSEIDGFPFSFDTEKYLIFCRLQKNTLEILLFFF